MQNKPDDKEVLARRELLECAHDPCAYDHFCSNHRLLADLERELAGAHEWLAKWRRIAGEASETIGRLREEASSATLPTVEGRKQGKYSVLHLDDRDLHHHIEPSAANEFDQHKHHDDRRCIDHTPPVHADDLR